MSTENSVVAIYRQHSDADLQFRSARGGVDMHKLSIVGKGYHTDDRWSATTIRRPHEVLGQGWSVLGRFWGLLFGSASS